MARALEYAPAVPSSQGIREPYLKRAMDLSLALVGLAVASPLWFGISLAIFLDDRGPALFVHERCGRDGQPFRHLKFRTMTQPPRGERAHRLVFIDKDPRVTRVGKLLRAVGLDELPQLVNIVRGEMSFVGPRPQPFRADLVRRERQDGVIEETSPYRSISDIPGYELRCRVRPGLTGLAQVCAPRGIGQREKFRYDGIYVRRMSLWLDVRLIVLSVWITLRCGWEKRRRKAR